MSLSAGSLRSGRLACVCPPTETGGRDPAAPRVVGGIAASFGLAMLAQALSLGILPLAARRMTDAPILLTLPVGLIFLGAALASLPAALLSDRIGRRDGLALGGAFGIAGGFLTAIAIVTDRYGLLALGAFWLGVAQGFAFYGRHLATASAGRLSPAAVSVVLGAGVLAGLLGPTVATTAEALTSPYLYAGSALAAAGAHALAALSTLAIPAHDWRVEGEAPLPMPGWGPWAIATLPAALGWAMMAAGMAAAPLALADCGLGSDAITGALSLHLLAMYAPAFLVAPLARRIRPTGLSLAGVISGLAGLALMLATRNAPTTELVALLLLGSGWSLGLAGAGLKLVGSDRRALAAHDAAVLIAALAGTAFAGFLV